MPSENEMNCATWLGIVSQLYSTRMGQVLMRHEMTLGQFGILNNLARRAEAAPQRISDIAEAVEVNQPAVTKTIASFETLGFVDLTSDRKDRRAKLVKINADGIAHLSKIHQSIAPEMAGMFSGFLSYEVDQLTDGLKKLAIWLDENRL